MENLLRKALFLLYVASANVIKIVFGMIFTSSVSKT